MTGKTFDILVHEDDRKKILANFRERLVGGGIPDEYRFVTKTGEVIWGRVISHPDYHGDKIAGLHGLIIDITETKSVSEEREKEVRLESIGILAGGIAHEFNNILVSILGNISLARTFLGDNDNTQLILADAEDACNQAKNLASQLLTFAKGGAPVKQTADLYELINESTRFTLHGSNVKCKISLPDDLHPVNIDTAQINQVLHNLLINAMQAMPDGGIIEINSENVSLRSDSTMPLDEGKYVKIRVADQGSGIAPENLQKIFDPYFTTKKQGSGLGLSLSYSIIHQHGGHITVMSEKGSGAVFTMYLPVSKDAPETTTPTPKKTPSRTGRILVMDDEKSVRIIVSRMLNALGHEVVCAEEGMEAVGLYKSALDDGRRFDVVIMDLNVPGGMGGKEALKRILEIDPTACAIVSSGYSNNPVVAEYEKYGFSGNISKPYSMTTLKELVNDLLSR